MQQQTSMGTGQNTMSQPPQVITTKDLLYLTDMMSWNLTAMKKAHFFASQCQNQEIVQLINKCGQMHQKHYESFLSNLQSNGQGLQ